MMLRRSRQPVARHVASLLLAGGLAAAAGCSGTSSASAPGSASVPAEASATVVASPSSGPVAAAVEQFRDNYSTRTIELQLTNDGGAPLTVVAASLTAATNTEAMVWRAGPNGTELPPHQTKSLPVQLSPSSCAPGDTDAEARIVFRDGPSERAVVLPAPDPTASSHETGPRTARHGTQLPWRPSRSPTRSPSPLIAARPPFISCWSPPGVRVLSR